MLELCTNHELINYNFGVNMGFFQIFRYFLIFVFIVGFLSYLYFSHTGSFPTWGRKKKLLKILQENKTIRPNHKIKIAKAIMDLEPLYKKNGSIEYKALLQDLYIIKEKNAKLESVINTLIQRVSEINKYIGIPQKIANEFEQLEKAILTGNKTETEKVMGRLVAKLSESQQKNKRKNFVSNFFGILGGVVTVVEFINLILGALGV